MGFTAFTLKKAVQFNNTNMQDIEDKNYNGYNESLEKLERDERDSDYFMGADNGVPVEVLQPNGHGWEKFLSPLEVQTVPIDNKGNLFDTMSCVTFGILRTLQAIIYRKYGVRRLFAKRFTAVMSGTKPTGNSMYNVIMSVRKKHGAVDNDLYPAGGKSVEEYLQPIPTTLLKKLLFYAKRFLSGYKIYFEWLEEDEQGNVLPSAIVAALTQSPVVVSGRLNKRVDGVYQRSEDPTNHVFVVYDYKDREHFYADDHYPNNRKTLAWDFRFGAAMKFTVQRTTIGRLYDLLFIKKK